MTFLQERTLEYHEPSDRFYAGSLLLDMEDEEDAGAELALRNHLNDFANTVSQFKGEFWIASQFYSVVSESKLDDMIANAVWKDELDHLDPDLLSALNEDKYVELRIRRVGRGCLLGKTVTEMASGWWIVEELK